MWETGLLAEEALIITMQTHAHMILNVFQYFPFPRLLMCGSRYLTSRKTYVVSRCLRISPPPLCLALGRADVAPPIVPTSCLRGVVAGGAGVPPVDTPGSRVGSTSLDSREVFRVQSSRPGRVPARPAAYPHPTRTRPEVPTSTPDFEIRTDFHGKSKWRCRSGPARGAAPSRLPGWPPQAQPRPLPTRQHSVEGYPTAHDCCSGWERHAAQGDVHLSGFHTFSTCNYL